MWCRENEITHTNCIWPVIHGLALISIISCTSSPPPRSVTPAFYHWQTTLALSPTERAYLDSFGCKKLYIKVLDIGRDPVTGEIQPYSRLEIADTTGLAGLEIVPVVFMTNAVFQGITEERIAWLAEKVADVLNEPPPAPPGGGLPIATEIQFDCDWTPSTRNAFFLFLKKIKNHLPKHTRLSATIRLHQYKFPEKTGVPPVGRGMLMFYNTGDIENPEAGNSIFQPEDAEKYVVGAPKHYPLPLDLALPVFSWALVYRDDELWKILPEVPESELFDTLRFNKISYLKSAISNLQSTFRIQKGTFLSGHYLRPGDVLRVEAVSPELLREAARLAAQTDLANNATVAFFHIDPVCVRRYPVQLLDSVCQMIRFPEKKD